MAKRIRIVVGGVTADATLFEDKAPKTVQAFWDRLPLTGERTIQVRWSGDAWRTEGNYELRVGKLGHGNASWHGRTRDHRGSATDASPAGEDRRGGAFALRAGAIRPRARHTRSVARSLQADKHPPAHNPKVRRTFTSNGAAKRSNGSVCPTSSHSTVVQAGSLGAGADSDREGELSSVRANPSQPCMR